MHHELAIWVCSPKGVFYSGEAKLNVFHHSSFLAGGRVLAGGQWKVKTGKIVAITTKTGHYGTSPKQAYNALLLTCEARRFERNTAKIFRPLNPHEELWINTDEFLKKQGNYILCQAVSSPLSTAVF